VQGDRFEEERRFAALTKEKRANAARDKEINAELAELQEKILERWGAEGLRGVPLTDAKLELRREGWIKVKATGERATDAEKRAAIEALKAAGHEDLVSEGYNSRSVSSVAREEHWDRDMPPELEEHFTFEPEYKIIVKEVKPKAEDGAPDQLQSA
jgi:hypothetical protein